MSESTGLKFIFNEEIFPIGKFQSFEQMMETNPCVYEVVRVEDGIPLFLEDYFLRLKNSFAVLKIELPYNLERISRIIHQLIDINNHRSGPVKLVFGAGEKLFLLAFLMKANLPADQEYISGVRTILMKETRKNPNVKIWNRDLRQRSVKMLDKTGAYEAILVNPEGTITEASRSNIFFVKGEKIYTTPMELVLPGITRKKVIEVCTSKKMDVVLRKISLTDLSSYDSCFLTGTARKIVPVRSIDDIIYQTDTAMLRKISAYFEEFVAEYIELHS